MRPVVVGLLGLAFSATLAHGQLSVIQGPVEADVVRVVDGDTIDVKVMAWPDQAVWESIRIRGLDTPEIRGKCQAEKDLAQAAKKYLASMIEAQAGRVRLSVVGCNAAEGGGFGRCLANVSAGSVSVAEDMIERGLARENHGQDRGPWC